MSTPKIGVLVTHMGSNGGGPKFHYHLFSALHCRDDINAHYLITESADNKVLFEATGAPHLIASTYTSKLGLILGLPKLLVTALRLRSYIRRNSITVVINSMESIYQGLIAPIAIPRGVTYMSCVHDLVDHPGDEHVVKRVARWGERRRATEFVVFSRAVRGALEASSFRRGRSVRETVHGAFGTLSSPSAIADLRKGESSVVRIGFIGRLGKYKGLDILADSIRILRSRGLAVEGSVHGAGPEATLASTELGANLSWSIGWIDDEDMPRILDSFDILALPYTEASQSGVVAYAIARGLPIVVTPVGGLPEQILGASCGLVASGVSSTDFANSLEELVLNPNLRLLLGSNGLEASRTAFSWERVGNDLARWLAE